MSGSVDITIGRMRVEVDRDGMRQHSYGHGCRLSILDGWNSSCDTKRVNLSVDELRDLQYMVGRAIDEATRERDK